MAEIGTATVKVVADVSGIEPAVRAELERLSGLFAEVGRDELADMLGQAGLTRGVHPLVLADRLLDQFVIRHRTTETESDESADEA